MALFQKAVFCTTVAHLKDLPVDATREVAFVGRSNAGKSSAINTLAGHTRLAFVSKTPGRTQHLNYFTIEGGKYLVDLPGYGYAKAPEDIRKQWEGLLGPYLSLREPLVGLVLIMDSRHPLTPLDDQLLEWFVPTGRPIHILLSKADKLTRQQQISTLREVRGALADLGEQISVQLFSSLKKTGVDECERILAGWMDLPLPEQRAAEKAAALAAAADNKPPRINPRSGGQRQPAKKTAAGKASKAAGGTRKSTGK